MKKMSEKALEESALSIWRECVCGCWVHEDCIDDVVVESCGKERLCPVCEFLSFPCSCAASFKCFSHGIKACYNYTLGNIEIMCTEDTVN